MASNITNPNLSEVPKSIIRSSVPSTLYNLTKELSSFVFDTARWFVISALGRIKKGEVVIEDSVAGRTLRFGCNGGLTTTLVVKNRNLWWRVMMSSSIGFSESYMLGEVECFDITMFLEIMILNREALSDMSSPLSSVLSAVAGWTRVSNLAAVSLANVRAHYDISNAIFEAFLSPDMTYSCPIWPSQETVPAIFSLNDTPTHIPTASLEQAQIHKLRYIITQARISPGDRVLEIGTGWGSFAIEAAKSVPGCHVTSLTLSAEQKREAEARILAAGLEDRITILLQDYRSLSGTMNGNDVDDGKQGHFDKIVSIEMLEHVGKDHLPAYFSVVNTLLKKSGGIAVFQTSTMPETRYHIYNEGNDFIRQYIFPGAHLPTVTKLIASAHEGSKGDLIPDQFLNIGGHYSKCLREWKNNFVNSFEDRIRPALMKKKSGIDCSDDRELQKKFYFSFCEAGFRTKTLGVSLLTFVREGTVETLQGIKL
ncbi:methoxy mycolic acid synthase [Xylariaceae sp. FL0255]|nr:methoxy mycolic acid synthase [Xylariaceae sp. FL0255]